MESAGSAVVDFGRFCTGFLVVMGVGMCFSTARVTFDCCIREYRNICEKYFVLMCDYFSSSDTVGPLRHDYHSRNGYVDNWRAADLRDYHKLHDVLP